MNDEEDSPDAGSRDLQGSTGLIRLSIVKSLYRRQSVHLLAANENPYAGDPLLAIPLQVKSGLVMTELLPTAPRTLQELTSRTASVPSQASSSARIMKRTIQSAQMEELELGAHGSLRLHRDLPG